MQACLAELKAAQAPGSLLDAEAVEREWSDVLGTERAGMLAMLSRAGTIDVEVRAVLYNETLRFFTHYASCTFAGNTESLICGIRIRLIGPRP